MKLPGHSAVFCMMLILFGALCAAGCVANQSSVISPDDNSEYIGTWTLNSSFLENGELCDAAFTFKPDGTGLRELISPTTGKTVSIENLTWNRTGEFDTILISYEDGWDEITSLAWLKGTW